MFAEVGASVVCIARHSHNIISTVWAVKHVCKNEAIFVVADVTDLASLTQASQRLGSRL